jgi:hypothetical protein
MARVACTLGLELGRVRGVLYSRVAMNIFWFWVTRVRVDICKIWFYICRVVRKPQLGKLSGSNRRYFTRSLDLAPAS